MGSLLNNNKNLNWMKREDEPEREIDIKQVESLYPDEIRAHRQSINQSILDKYLNEEYPCVQYLERLLLRLIPYWVSSSQRIIRNLGRLANGEWEFQHLADLEVPKPANPNITQSLMLDIQDQSLAGKNISIYLVFWLPLSLMIVANVIHNQPGLSSRFSVAGAGAVLLGSMLLISYALYVFANVMKSPHSMYLQHLSLSSHVGILALLYAAISAAMPGWVLVPMTIAYGALSVYAHFRVYNRSCKPTLFEMVVLLLLISLLYGCTCYLFFVCLSPPAPPPATTSHLLLRNFNHGHSL